MSATIKQLSQELKIGRSGIEMRISKIPKFREKYTHKNHNRIIINDDGCRLIKKLYGVNQHVKDNQATSNDVNNNDETIKILKYQLAQSNKSQNRLEKLLDQQQQLQLATQKENTQLKGHIKHLKQISGHVDTDTKREEKGRVKDKKPGFFQRLFGKY